MRYDKPHMTSVFCSMKHKATRLYSPTLEATPVGWKNAPQNQNQHHATLRDCATGANL